MKTFVSVARFSLFALVAFASPHAFAVIDSGGGDGCVYIVDGDGNVTLSCSRGGGGSGFDSGGGGGGGGGSPPPDWLALIKLDKRFCKFASEACDSDTFPPAPNWRSRVVAETCATFIGIQGACNAAVVDEAKANMCASTTPC